MVMNSSTITSSWLGMIHLARSNTDNDTQTDLLLVVGYDTPDKVGLGLPQSAHQV